jgi:mannosyltransferase
VWLRGEAGRGETRGEGQRRGAAALRPGRHPTFPAPGLAALFAIALALRLYRIDAQSFWYDEGLTIALAVQPLDAIARAAAADVHPPLYYWLLHGWVLLMGTGEAAARAFSAICGAAAAVLTTILGRRWFGERAAWLAGIAASRFPFRHSLQPGNPHVRAGNAAGNLSLAGV